MTKKQFAIYSALVFIGAICLMAIPNSVFIETFPVVANFIKWTGVGLGVYGVYKIIKGLFKNNGNAAGY